MTILSAAGDADYVGEPVSQQQHALQCAYFAQKAGAPAAAVAAALLHDIGHLQAPPDAQHMANLGILGHEKYGSDFLRELGFAEKVCALVQGHVQAKRYLVYKNKAYFDRLSEASRQTLGFQGGPMSDDEAVRFEADPLFKIKLAVREWDERAKVPELEVPGLASYNQLLLGQMTAD
ncbi:MAG: HD domain-containing protein [Deltaproteobacteria bacterium]|nr:HD domain-containing protein [Deltaproteobacteria bacterium]